MQFIQYQGLLAYCQGDVPTRVEQMIAQPARIIRSFALTITVLCIGTACSSMPAESKTDVAGTIRVSGSASTGERAAAYALQQVGVPYRYGGSSPGGFDCSGLVQYSYSQAGMSVARTTAQLWATTRAVDRQELQVGDLLFFRFDGKMSHVAMYIGGQRFVHAPSSGKSVTVASLDTAFYEEALIRARRPR